MIRWNRHATCALAGKNLGTGKSMNKDTDEDAPKRQAIRAQIDENLKRVYTATLNEELPDRFRDLLDQLKGLSDKGGRT